MTPARPLLAKTDTAPERTPHVLANGRSCLAIRGPSVMPDAVLGATQRAAPNIYEGEGQGGPLTINAGPDSRSHAVTALRLGDGRADRLRDCARRRVA